MKQGFGRSLRADCPFNPVEGAGFPFPSLTLRRNSCGTLPHLYFLGMPYPQSISPIKGKSV